MNGLEEQIEKQEELNESIIENEKSMNAVISSCTGLGVAGTAFRLDVVQPLLLLELAQKRQFPQFLSHQAC